MSPIIDVLGVGMSYGKVQVLKDVTLSVERGEIFAIIGPNGAGKTTMFRVMTGEVSTHTGKVHYQGQDITPLTAMARARAGIGRTFQVARVFQDYSALDNLVVTIESRKKFRGEPLTRRLLCRPNAIVIDEAMEWLDQMDLKHRAATQARFLSHGDRKRLEFAVALSMRPTVLMLDEPMAGTAAEDRQAMSALINKTRREHGVTVVITEHDTDVIFGLADRVAVLNYGQLIAQGLPAEVRVHPKVREVYLGQEAGHA
jgi:branched-chain amino acid transport system ATP-binding protein